jgi:mannosyl-oligosaccharide alpha-1,2-mannosidase
LIDKVNAAWDSTELFPTSFNPKGNFVQHWSWAGGSDSFYEYLLKGYIQTRSPNKLRMYSASVTAALDLLLHTDLDGNLFLGEVVGSTQVNKMDHLTCFAPGMLLLGTRYDKSNSASEVTRVAEGLMKTCYLMYTSSATGLSSETVWFQEHMSYPSFINSEYILRPETLESLFYFYYMTGDSKYQQWAWDIFSAIDLWCKAPYGYSAVNFVNSADPQQTDSQESFFLAETLKYLYLLFSDPIPLDLDSWVLNTEAHPLKLVK